MSLSFLLLVTVALIGYLEGSDTTDSSSDSSATTSADSALFLSGRTGSPASLEGHPDSNKDEGIWTLTPLLLPPAQWAVDSDR